MISVTKLNITVRGVDDRVFRKFKAKAVEEDMKLGEALTQAMELWIRHVEERRLKARLLDIKPFSWGEGSEKTSTQLDEVLYGGSP